MFVFGVERNGFFFASFEQATDIELGFPAANIIHYWKEKEERKFTRRMNDSRKPPPDYVTVSDRGPLGSQVGSALWHEQRPENDAAAGSAVATGAAGVSLLEPQSRFGDKPLKFRAICPQNGTAVLKGLINTRDVYILKPFWCSYGGPVLGTNHSDSR